MSVLKYLEELREKSKSLKKSLADLTVIRDNLAKNVKLYAGRTSSVAQTLYNESSAKLAENEKEIRAKTEEYCSVSAEIERLENDPKNHIEEQTMLMANAFFEYVKKNFDELARQATTHFKVEFCDPNSIEYEVHQPRNVQIRNVAKYIPIAEECDRYFSSALTGYVNDVCATYTPDPSHWYQEYLKKFYAELKKKLIEDNPYKDTFRIKFNGFTFILDLI